MATSVDKSYSMTWAKFHSESTIKVMKLLRKSKSLDTLLETTSWILKDIPEYNTVTTLHPISLPTVPLTKWELLLHEHGEDNYLHPRGSFTSSKSCPSLVCRPESSAAFVLHSATDSYCEEIPSIANQPEDVSSEETNQAEKTNIKDQEFVVEEKEGLILENDYLTPAVTISKLVNQRTNTGPEVMEESLAGRNVLHSEYFDRNTEVDQVSEKTDVAEKPEHLEQIGSMESLEYSFTRSKRKPYCAEDKIQLVNDKAETDCKSQQTRFTLGHYQALDVDFKYSEELFDEIDDDDSASLETRTLLCLPFLCLRRRNKHEKEQKTLIRSSATDCDSSPAWSRDTLLASE
ncbi:uncharacterized protein LOC134359668 [Mobula hypostoma]|uniref:uncharacterized protein LOC134359668 n=1 Tax=Mobula hypostoma TaxID=723540 RepID=UPI002FC286EF